jgi:O-antigen/teichoic acid export membrane protein
VAATLFAVHSFAAFTIAAILGPMINLCRMSVNHAFLPSMSRLQAAGDVSGMLALNSRANAMVGRLVFPFLAVAFVFAEEMITVVYTSSYLEAANVMRVYIVGFSVLVVELFSITFLLREGAFALRLNLMTLAVSIAASWGGAKLFGLPGAAVGSAAVLFLDRFATLQRIAARVGIPISRLQDWRTLGLQCLFAIAGGLAAWAVSHEYMGDSRPLIRLIAGTVVVLAVYAALYGLFGTSERSGLMPADEWKA